MRYFCVHYLGERLESQGHDCWLLALGRLGVAWQCSVDYSKPALALAMLVQTTMKPHHLNLHRLHLSPLLKLHVTQARPFPDVWSHLWIIHSVLCLP